MVYDEIPHDPYLIGQIGEAIAQRRLHLRRLHVVSLKECNRLVKEKKMCAEIPLLLSKYDHVVDLFTIVEQDDISTIELYEVKTRFHYLPTPTSWRIPKIGWKTVEMAKEAELLSIKFYIALITIYPSWKYHIEVRPYNVNDFVVDKPRIRSKNGASPP